MLLARRGAERARALELERPEWKAGRTVRIARNVLGKVRRAAKSVSKRIKADVSARREAGLAPVKRDQVAAQLRDALLDLAREAADIGRELATCSSDIPRAVGAGRKARRKARRAAATGRMATSCASCRRTKGSASSTREDDLRALLRALLADKRSMRARVGRCPAVFRRPAFRSRHTALAREFFKPTAASSSETYGGCEKFAISEAEGLRHLEAQLRSISWSASELAAILSAVDGGSSDDACAAVLAEGEGVCRVRE